MKELSVTDVQKGLRLLANEGHDLAHGPDMIKLHGKPYFSMYNNIRKSPNTDNWHGMSNIPLGENGAIAHISTHTDGTDSMYILGVPHAELDEHGQMHPGYGGSFYHCVCCRFFRRTFWRKEMSIEKQEPFGYFRYDLQLDAWVQNRESDQGTPFYTAPPKREWVGLNWDDLPEIYVGDTAFLHGAKWAEEIGRAHV